jgi:Ca-activated chloride channel homolog
MAHADMSASLTLSATLNTTTVPASYQERLVYLLLEIGGGGAVSSHPLDLALVIDCSDSMRIYLVDDEQFEYLVSQYQTKEILNDQVPAWSIDSLPEEISQHLPTRLKYVKEALQIAAEKLLDTDRFSMITFAGDVRQFLPVLPGTQRGKLKDAAAALEELDLGDGTQLSAGLALGYNNLNQASASLSNHKHSRRLLLLTDGFTNDVHECYKWAIKARENNIAITTFGLGNEFNEDLLIPLADMTGGNAYYIDKIDQLPFAFKTELENARNMTYLNLELKLRLPLNVQLQECFRVQPTLSELDTGPVEGNIYNLFLGPLDPETPQALLLGFLVQVSQPGNYRLAQAVLSWDDPNPAQGRPKYQSDIILPVTGNPTIQYQQKVMNVIERVNAYKMGTQALSAARSGDNGYASEQMRRAATQLLEMGEQRLGQLMLANAQALEEEPQADQNAIKRLRYDTRCLKSTPDVPFSH